MPLRPCADDRSFRGRQAALRRRPLVLASREIELPQGETSDPQRPRPSTARQPQERPSSCGSSAKGCRGLSRLGALRRGRAAAGCAIAVVSRAPTAATCAGGRHRRVFEARVDGVVAERRRLRGKPARTLSGRRPRRRAGARRRPQSTRTRSRVEAAGPETSARGRGRPSGSRGPEGARRGRGGRT